jgi:flagellar biosynthetic protein FlhB
MADQDLDRNEPATPFKLEKAREQGQTPRSTDAVSSIVFLAAMVYLAAQGTKLCASLLQLSQAALLQASRTDAATSAWPLMVRLVADTAAALLPFLLALPLVAVLAALAQTGMVFSLTPLQIDFNRINPATGIKRVFSLRTVFDGGRACMKLLVLTVVGAVALQALLPQFHAITALSPAAFLDTLVEDVTGLGVKMGLALVLVSAADMLFTRREFGRNMRMSRRELKDEYKNREGDPRVRNRLRELRRELLKRSLALKNTRTADVVLTNPTHYAVALRYIHGEMEAPRVVAKGAGQLAAAMREIAARHNVIVVQNPPLARGLFREGAIDEYIPAGFHAEVARIIVWVLAVRRQREACA